jgi:hypothetical protein
MSWYCNISRYYMIIDMYLIWATYIHVFKEKSDIISLLVTIVICDCIIARSKTSIKRVVGCPSVVFSWSVINHNLKCESQYIIFMNCERYRFVMCYFTLADVFSSWSVIDTIFSEIQWSTYTKKQLFDCLCRHYSLCIRGKLYLTDCAFLFNWWACSAD